MDVANSPATQSLLKETGTSVDARIKALTAEIERLQQVQELTRILQGLAPEDAKPKKVHWTQRPENKSKVRSMASKGARTRASAKSTAGDA
jgi:hypothetical protein